MQGLTLFINPLDNLPQHGIKTRDKYGVVNSPRSKSSFVVG